MSEISQKVIRGLTFNVNAVKAMTEAKFLTVCKGYAKNEKCSGHLAYKGVSDAEIKKDYAKLVPNETKEEKEKK